MENFSESKESLAIAEKKALLRPIFKKIGVKEGQITDYELYELFKTILSEIEVECQFKEIQILTGKPDVVYTYACLADRMYKYRGMILRLLKRLNS